MQEKKEYTSQGSAEHQNGVEPGHKIPSLMLAFSRFSINGEADS